MASPRVTPVTLTGAEVEKYRALLPEWEPGLVYSQPPWDDEPLPVSMLNVAQEMYQRDFNTALFRRIVREYNPLLMQPIDVNMREDGSLWVMDGQHRVAAMRELFGPHAMIDCRVFYGLTPEQEALIFGMQDQRKPLTPRERFRGGLRAGREPYVTVSALVESAGWYVMLDDDAERGTGHGARIAAVGALLEVARHIGGDVLVHALRIIGHGFGHKYAPTSAEILGFSTFLNWYAGDAEYDERVFLERLHAIGHKGFQTMVENHRAASHVMKRDAVSQVLVKIYNKGRRMPQQLISWETALQRSKGKFRGNQFGAGEAKA